MQRADSRPDSSVDTRSSPYHQRKESSNSEMPSQLLQRKESRSSISNASLVLPTHLVPEPAYIATSAASQIVNSEYVSRGPNWLDSEGSDDGLAVTPTALVLVNAFLDQLLFSFLKGARSTSIMALKPAINDILKPRLAKDAIQGADEELQGYLTGGDDEELSDFHNGQELTSERNLQRIFRRTRLRCMVYTRLGDMEEEDEDMYLENESAPDMDERSRLSNDLGNVSPAAAIFLTSILEFIGEQALMIAGEAAYNRMGIKKPMAEERNAAVEEGDVEKLAFNTTLGRLWRSWKNRTRPTSMSSARPTSRDFHGRKPSMSRSGMTSRATSISEVNNEGLRLDGTPYHDRSVAEILHDDPANIPLPPSRGLPEEPDFGSDDEDTPDANDPGQIRRRSMFEYQAARDSGMFTQLHAMGMGASHGHRERPAHKRAHSMPVGKTTYPSDWEEKAEVPPEASLASEAARNEDIEGVTKDGRDKEGEEEEEEEEDENHNKTPKLGDDSQPGSKLAIGNPNVSTIYDGVLGSDRDSTIAHSGKTREVSMISDYSNAATDGSYDNDMTPQALNFKKSDKHSLAPTEESHPDSHASTISDEYSFGNGDAPTGIFGPPSIKKIDKSEKGTVEGPELVAPPDGPEDEEATRGSSKNIVNLATVQGDKLRTYDENGKAVKRDIPVLYEDPSNQDVIYKPKAPPPTTSTSKDLPEEPPVAKPSKPASYGVPPLTPLRELRDAAHDTSDEASSVSAGYDHDGYRSDDIPPPPPQVYKNKTSSPKGASYFSPPPLPSQGGTQITEQPSTAASKLVDIRNQPLPVSPGAERAAVQRVSPAPGNNRDVVSPMGRNSTSSNKDTRPLTSNSTGGKLHKIVTRESTDSGRQGMLRRSSSGQSDMVRNGHRAGSGSQSGNKELDFENLINSDETIQYTLTPQNMREMETPNSPRWSQRPDVIESATRTRTKSTDQSISPASASPKNPKGLNGFRANQSPTSNGPSSVTDFNRSPKKTSVSSRAEGPIPKSPNGRQGAPRDPTLKNDSSMRDFADFIRSTGPESDPRVMYKATATGGKQHSRNASNNSQTANTGKPLPKKISKHVPVIAPSISPRTGESSNKPTPQRSTSKLKARDPVVASDSTTADLADFLRSGPPGAHVDAASPAATPRQAQKQSSTIAPTNGVTNGRMLSTGSFASTQDSYSASKMTQSSSNSRTGLLENRGAPVINHQAQRGGGPSAEVGGPVRKQRRVRDPYALESDNEDEEDGEDDFQHPHQPEQEEESLSDFLRNYAPPSDESATPTPTLPSTAMAGNSRPQANMANQGKERKANGPTMRERIARNIAVIPDYRTAPPKAPKKSSSKPAERSQNFSNPPQQQSAAPQRPAIQRGSSSHSSSRTNPTPTAPQLPPLNPRATSPHLISQNGTKLDTYKPTRPTYAAHVDRSNRPKPQARDEGAASTGGGMGDLAEFLRDTEPPAGIMMMGSTATATGGTPEPVKKGGGGFGGMFGRRRKV